MGKIMLIDGNSIINRAFYGIRLLSTGDGVYTNALLGFLNILLKLREEDNPDGLAVCFDLKEPTFRHKSFDGYKAQRKPMPEELAMQVPLLKELLDAMNIRRYELPGYEADDLLGTLSKKITGYGDECVLVTGDRDSLQLVGGGTVLKYVSTRAGHTESKLYDALTINLDYGIEPEQFIDVKALMGDASDNIPGVRGIGEKTAFDLIIRFSTLDGVYQNIDSPDIKPAVREKLIAGKESAYMSRSLATIDRDAPISCTRECFSFSAFDNDRLYALLDKLEMRSIIARLGLKPPQKTEVISVSERKASVKEEISDFEKAKSAVSGLRGEVGFAIDGASSFAVSFGENTLLFTPESDENTKALLSVLFSSDVRLICHNAKPIFRFCLSNGLPSPDICFDTMLAAYLLSEPMEIGALCEKELGYCIDTGDDGSQSPLEGFADAASESGAAYRLRPVLAEKLREINVERLYYDVELPLCAVLADMENEGFLVDTDALTDFGVELDKSVGNLEKEIFALAGERFNIASPKQLSEVLFEKLRLPSGKKTKTGYSTNYDVLKHLAPYHEIIPKILEYRNLSKLKSTYVDGLLKVVSADGRIHTTFNQTGTVTGRLSSSEPNLQNIPVRSEPGSRFRDMFVAREGYLLVDADYSQIELRILAHTANDEIMKKAFENGEDIHRITASQVFDVPPEQVTAKQRSFSKAVNFGIVYGISDFSLADDIGTSRSEAKWIIEKYLTKYSGVKKYMDRVIAQAKEDGYVSTLDGRRRYLPDIRSTNHNIRTAAERVALNTPIQGTAADIIKRAMVNVARRMKNEGLRAKLILQVHDELIVEAPADETERVKALLSYEMEYAAQLSVKLTADSGAGKSWAEAKRA
jgi:DNA polymerase-1